MVICTTTKEPDCSIFTVSGNWTPDKRRYKRKKKKKQTGSPILWAQLQASLSTGSCLALRHLHWHDVAQTIAQSAPRIRTAQKQGLCRQYTFCALRRKAAPIPSPPFTGTLPTQGQYGSPGQGSVAHRPTKRTSSEATVISTGARRNAPALISSANSSCGSEGFLISCEKLYTRAFQS